MKEIQEKTMLRAKPPGCLNEKELAKVSGGTGEQEVICPSCEHRIKRACDECPVCGFPRQGWW